MIPRLHQIFPGCSVGTSNFMCSKSHPIFSLISSQSYYLSEEHSTYPFSQAREMRVRAGSRWFTAWEPEARCCSGAGAQVLHGCCHIPWSTELIGLSQWVTKCEKQPPGKEFYSPGKRDMLEELILVWVVVTQGSDNRCFGSHHEDTAWGERQTFAI